MEADDAAPSRGTEGERRFGMDGYDTMDAARAARAVLQEAGYCATMKVHRVLYLAQAAAAACAEPLLAEPFRATSHGPVLASLLPLHRGRFVIGPEDARGWGTGAPVPHPLLADTARLCARVSSCALLDAIMGEGCVRAALRRGDMGEIAYGDMAAPWVLERLRRGRW